jgi:RNA polymerase sigma-70 factor (ECF subfamily)
MWTGAAASRRRRRGAAALQEPEPDVVRAAAAGDLDAFEQLVRAHQARVWRFLRHLLGDATLAEDVAQETVLRVFQRLDSFSQRSSFSTWVLQVARNAGLDALRTQARRGRLLGSLAPLPAAAAADDAAEVNAALGSLRPKLREAVLIVQVLGLSYREAGQVLGVPEGTVKSRVAKARHDLLAWLSEEEQAREV